MANTVGLLSKIRDDTFIKSRIQETANPTSSREEQKHCTSCGSGLYIAGPAASEGAAIMIYRLLMMTLEGESWLQELGGGTS